VSLDGEVSTVKHSILFKVRSNLFLSEYRGDEPMTNANARALNTIEGN